MCLIRTNAQLHMPAMGYGRVSIHADSCYDYNGQILSRNSSGYSLYFPIVLNTSLGAVI